MSILIIVVGVAVFVGSVALSRRTHRPAVPGFLLGIVLVTIGALLQATCSGRNTARKEKQMSFLASHRKGPLFYFVAVPLAVGGFTLVKQGYIFGWGLMLAGAVIAAVSGVVHGYSRIRV